MAFIHVYYSINNSLANRHFYLMRDTFPSQTVERRLAILCHSPFHCMWTQNYQQYKSVGDVSFSKVVYIRIRSGMSKCWDVMSWNNNM